MSIISSNSVTHWTFFREPDTYGRNHNIFANTELELLFITTLILLPRMMNYAVHSGARNEYSGALFTYCKLTSLKVIDSLNFPAYAQSQK